MRQTELESARHDTVVARNEQIIAAPVGEELAMMDVETGSYYLLDDIAGFVWSLINRPKCVGDLLVEIQRAYDVTPAQCEQDVLPLLERMRARGLVLMT